MIIASPRTDPALPLCVDLDGTLVRVDLLHDAVAGLLRSRPHVLAATTPAGLRGKAAFKRAVADRQATDPVDLPYTGELLDYLRSERLAGRRIVLVTAADVRVAEAVATHLGLFDEVIASDGCCNLRGAAKASALVERFGEKGFDYAGNDHADLAVWRVARRAVVVNARASVRDRAAALAPIEHEFGAPPQRFRAVVRLLRPHQWVKNLLVFVPLLAAHAYGNASLFAAALVYFVAFSAVASGVYVFNDLVDVAADRRHPTKRRRPFASGDLSPLIGVAVGPALLAGGLALGFLESVVSGLILVAYVAVNAAYSSGLKRVPLVDVFVLATFYVARLFGGGAACEIVPSEWLVAFAGFFFLGLAFLKRTTELIRLAGKEGGNGRGYEAGDREMVERFGIASGFLASLVLALYVRSPIAVHTYGLPELLWLTVPLLLLWTCRMWLLTGRGQMLDDPITFALKDRFSWGILGLLLAVVAAARLLP